MSQAIEEPVAPHYNERAQLRRAWWLFLLLGLVSLVVGFLAVSSTVVATMASVLVFGVLLLVAGVTEVIHAILVRNWRGFALHLLTAGLYLIVGLFMIEDPVRAASVLTLLIAAGFLVGGGLRIIFALVERFHSWAWVVLHGVIDLVLGGIILSGWPGSALWVIGLFLGIDLIFQGWSWVILGLTVRSVASELQEPSRL